MHASEDTVSSLFRQALNLAEKGEASAQLAVGQMLLNGIGTVRDVKGALHWFLASAMQGHPMGCNMVGRCCELGWGITSSSKDAMLWYQRAAHAGLDWGMYNYATGLSLGWITEPDYVSALYWFRRAAALGHCKSFNMIGSFYEDGWGVAKDLRRARAYYLRASRCGDFRGHFNFARFVLQEGDLERACEHLTMARRQATHAFIEKMDQFLGLLPLEGLYAVPHS